MKWLLILLTSSLPFSVAGVLARQPAEVAVSQTAGARVAELGELNKEHQEICRKMALLESQGRNFLPR